LQPKRVRWPKGRLSEPVRLRIDVRGAYRVDLQSAIPSFSILKSRVARLCAGGRCKDVLYSTLQRKRCLVAIRENRYFPSLVYGRRSGESRSTHR
jgi:hypothetical protein